MSDPARKYIPAPKGERRTHGSKGSSTDVNHGTFTTIAYGTAWGVAIIGSAVGSILILQSFETQGYGRSGSPDMASLLAGIATVASSWIGASGVGTLAEISRKLTKEGVLREAK